MSDMARVSMYASVQSVARRVRAVDSVQIKSVQTASQVKNVPVLQEQSVDQSVKVESSQKDSLMKRVKEQSKYMVGLVIMFVVTGVILLLAGVFMLYLVAYMKNLGV
jgi:hypothetical protein